MGAWEPAFCCCFCCWYYCCSVAQLGPTLCNSTDCSMPGFPVHHLPELAQTHVHWVSIGIQPSHSLSSLSPLAFNLSQHPSFLMSRLFASKVFHDKKKVPYGKFSEWKKEKVKWDIGRFHSNLITTSVINLQLLLKLLPTPCTDWALCVIFKNVNFFPVLRTQGRRNKKVILQAKTGW